MRLLITANAQLVGANRGEVREFLRGSSEHSDDWWTAFTATLIRHMSPTAAAGALEEWEHICEQGKKE